MEKQYINLDRLMKTFEISNSIGKVSDTGISRLALSNEDKIMRDIFTSWLHAEGLDVRVDDFGNIYGRREGMRNDLDPVVTGSHLDTQVYGGRYDGILGVLSALEMIKVLNENNIQTLRPIEIVNFTNEEGVRFAPGALGSGSITNVFTKEFAYQIKDKDGYSFGDELKRIGYLGDKKNRLTKAHSYVELHIEQAPVLEDQNKSIGIVTGDRGTDWLEITINGATNHSTSTPMSRRKDALFRQQR
ncbi:hydantoinase/carbamoylase family amidase [Siminovitchia sediminis]|uniref:Hydantoinase/carbamoylase family amidase n=1 Tax=Siminovitchia sediminis TaxID=1274353 RepID=A0ABW4KFN2_9BACI